MVRSRSAVQFCPTAQKYKQLSRKLDSCLYFGYGFFVAGAYRRQHAEVAQLVEHFTRNEKVAGPIPAFGSKKYINKVYSTHEP